MPRIGTYFESRLGRNDGNPLYVTAALKRLQYYGCILAGRPDDSHLNWFPAKSDLKTRIMDKAAESAAKELWEKHKETIEVDHFYPTGEITPFGTYDLNIWTDWGEDGLTGILPYKPIDCPKPMIYWASDTHIKAATHDSYDYRLSMAKKADYVFVAQKDAVERMKKDGVQNPIWLPHAVEPLAYPKIELAAKKYDVCFVGHINTKNREDALDRLFREFPNFYYGQQLFENAAQKFCESKIVFNIAMTDDINMRNFEALGTGSFLMTNWIPTIDEIFEDGKHLVLYRSEEEMIDKAKYYLAHDEEREKIAQAGYEHVMENHTILHRVLKMLEVVRESRLVLA
jgi:hypothetical protein